MTMFRLQPTSVSGFPRRGSLAACHALRTDPPSSNPACGFPALGLPENSRLGHSQGVARLKRSQIHQSQSYQVVVYTSALWNTKGSLAPTLEMGNQAKFKKTVDLAECFAWITVIEVVPPAYQLPVDLDDHAGNWHTTAPSGRQFAQLIALTSNRFLRHKHVEVPLFPVSIQTSIKTKGKAQKIKAASYFFEVYHLGLFPIDLQAHPGFQLGLNPVAEPIALMPRQNHKVVGVSHQSSIGPVCRTIRSMEHLIKPVQVKVSQQRRNDALNAKENFEFEQRIKNNRGK
jgi:hypothetical protein